MNRHKTAEALKKVGSRFQLCVLLQKRVIELVRGAPQLVECDSRNVIDVALEEILADKISLVEQEGVPESFEEMGALESIETFESEESGSLRF